MSSLRNEREIDPPDDKVRALIARGCMMRWSFATSAKKILLRGTILNRAYGIHKTYQVNISLFLRTIFLVLFTMVPHSSAVSRIASVR